MKMKKILLVFTFLLGANASAATVTTQIIDMGVVRSQGYVFLNISPVGSSACGRNDQVRWEIQDETSKAMLSIALSAFTSGKKVKMDFPSNDCLGDSSRPGFITITN